MMVQVLRILTIILSMCACLETRKMKNKSDENKGTVDIDWSYLYGQDTGPDTWADNYPDCGGPLQTPIDLPAVKDLTSSSSKPLVLKGYNKKPKKQFLKNDGRTAKLEGKYKKPPTMSILNKTYTFVQLHFHWGEYDDLGSEHTVDGEAFPLEIHFVHQSKDGSLAVLGVFADIDDEYPRDSVLYPLWDEFVEIEEAGDKLRLKNRDMIVIDDFLPDDLSSYYSRGLVPHPDGQNGVFNSTSANFLNDPNIDPSKARHSDQIRLAELNPFILKKCRSSHTDDINQLVDDETNLVVLTFSPVTPHFNKEMTKFELLLSSGGGSDDMVVVIMMMEVVSRLSGQNIRLETHHPCLIPEISHSHMAIRLFNVMCSMFAQKVLITPRHSPPMFASDRWNQHHATLANEPRTNICQG
ncbi:carbonic anhydrase 6-like [Oratosquilla oratoria]|uniref:carbonic anhydrase 6-like n=1 Tax=Oratosquilla oratoria TaxID=337810 RepID=UPI003F77457B